MKLLYHFLLALACCGTSGFSQILPAPSLSIPTPPTGITPGGRMGVTLAMSNGRTITSSTVEQTVKVFDTNTGALQLIIRRPDLLSGPDFGESVAASGNLIAVGNSQNDTGATNTGTVYIYDMTSATPAVPVFTINNPSPNAEDSFGKSVAIDGTKVVVGATLDDTAGTDSGTVYVYDLAGANPTSPIRVMSNPSPAASDLFGGAVSINGSRVAVGASQDDTGASNAGAVYVYDIALANPNLSVLVINNPEPASGDAFGIDVSLAANKLAVGASLNDKPSESNSGSAYVFDIGGNSPTVPLLILDNPGPGSVEFFGRSLRMSGSVLVVGAHYDNGVTGAAYVYDLASATPSDPALSLAHPAGTGSMMFGYRVAVNGNVIAASSIHDNTGADASGSIFQYSLSSTTPAVPTHTLNSPRVRSGDQFGQSVQISGANYIVGTFSDVAYIFSASAQDPMIPILTLEDTDLTENDGFGSSVAISKYHAVVAAPLDDAGGADSGSVFVYELAGQTPATPVLIITNPQAASSNFGGAIAISGRYVAVGASLDDTGAVDSGVVYIYDLEHAIPATPILTIPNPSPGAEEGFGRAVDLSGKTLIVAASSVNSGEVYVYDIGGGTPAVPMLTLPNPSPSTVTSFGQSLALSGRNLAVGTWNGGAYLFDLDGVSPTVPALSFQENGGFGKALALSGSLLVVGAPDHGTPYPASGRAYLYDLSSASPTVASVVFPNPDPINGDEFGAAVAISGTGILIGTPGDDKVATSKGWAYLFGQPDTTLAPSVTAPVAGASVGTPISVTFSLPEAALPGSVKLGFNSTVLSLAGGFAAGSHTVTFDASNPTANPVILSGAPIPDGSYSITVTYQDLAENPAAASAPVTGVIVDTMTLPPTLTSPPSGAMVKSPVSVSFTLPEAAATGSLKLSFGSTVLTLADSLASAGSHTLSFNPGSPASSASIISGAAIVDGVYDVSLSYQDVLGNPAAASTMATGVLIDTVGPALTLPGNIQADNTSALGMPITFTASALDLADPTPDVVASPASGSTFPIGTTTVNVSATDDAGNVSLGSFTVTISLLAPEIVVSDQPGSTLYQDGVSVVTMGSNGLGNSSEKTFVIQNAGNYGMAGISAEILGTDASSFSITQEPDGSLPIGGQTSLIVSFTPTSQGQKSATLRIHSDDGDEGIFDIGLLASANAVRLPFLSFSQVEDKITVRVPVSLTTASSVPIAVPFARGGNATALDATILTASPLVFAASKTEAYIDISIKDDLVAEGEEILTITLLSPVGSAAVLLQPALFSLSITEDDVLPVIAPPLISQIAAVGDDVTFTTQVTGSAPLTLKWKRGSTQLTTNSTSNLLLSSVTLADAATYTLTASNQRGPASSSAQLAVVDTSNTVVRTDVGTSPKLTALAKGTGLSYRWRKGNVDLPLVSPDYSGVNSAVLTIKSTTSDDAGHYSCNITAPGGSMRSGDFHVQIPTAVPVAITPALPDVVLLNPYRYQLTFNTDPALAPTKFVCSGLPKGLTCHPTTGLISGAPTVTGDFTVTITLSNFNGPSTTVQDTFTVRPFPTEAVGSFVALVGRDELANGSLGGRVDLTVSSLGAYSGSITLGATTTRLKGQMLTAPAPGSNPGFSLTVPRKGNNGVVIALDVNLLAANEMSGYVVQQGQPEVDNVLGWKNVWLATAPAQQGLHSLVLGPDGTGPEGFGFASATVTSKGISTVKGQTADGASFTCTAPLGPDGKVLVFATTLSNKASVLGTLGMDADAQHLTSGSLTWQKIAATKPREYGPFGPVTLTVLGGLHSVTNPMLGLPPPLVGATNAKVGFTGAGVPSATDPNVELRISDTNNLTVSTTNQGSVKFLSFSPSTGAFKGQFKLLDPPAAPRIVTFQGQLVPTAAKGYGYFLLPQLADPMGNPATTATTSPILSGKVVLEAK